MRLRARNRRDQSLTENAIRELRVEKRMPPCPGRNRHDAPSVLRDGPYDLRPGDHRAEASP